MNLLINVSNNRRVYVSRLKKYKRFILILMDMIFINISFLLALSLRFANNIPPRYIKSYEKNFIAITFIYLVSLYSFRLYKSLWYYACFDEFILAIGGCITGGSLCMLYVRIISSGLPYSVGTLATLFSIMLILGTRVSFRLCRKPSISFKYVDKSDFKKVMIIGAGYSGNLIIKEMQTRNEMKYLPVTVIDDDKAKIGRIISGVLVEGNRNKIVELVNKHSIDVIIIAISSIDSRNKEAIINICSRTKCKLKIVPGIYELLDEKTSLSQLRDVDVEDLLGREAVMLNMEGISSYIEDKIILITGGGGSIGSALARQIARFNPRRLIILDLYENNAYELQVELRHNFPHLDIKLLIASVRDRKRMSNIFKEYKPEVVFHAAAHKHVPLMEENPYEAVKNNVFGTLNTAELAKEFGTKKFVLISTDKAVNPTNIMGATKRICEMIVQSINEESTTDFVAVRFGNVLGSNGSVIPLFKKQISYGGPVTLTHKEITRFFMTIQEAAQLVLQAGAFAKGGEIFVLDMGKPVKIYDLACELIRLSGFEPHRDIEICYTGLRQGEKLYEEVLMDEEGLNITTHNKIFIGKPLNIKYPALKKDLADLEEIVDKNEVGDLVKTLKKMVPTYICETVDQVAATSHIEV